MTAVSVCHQTAERTLSEAAPEQWGALLQALGASVRPVEKKAESQAPCTVTSLLGMMDQIPDDIVAAAPSSEGHRSGVSGRARPRRKPLPPPQAPAEQDTRDLDELLRQLGESPASAMPAEKGEKGKKKGKAASKSAAAKQTARRTPRSTKSPAPLPTAETVDVTTEEEAEVAPTDCVCETAAEPTRAETLDVTTEEESEVAPTDSLCEGAAKPTFAETAGVIAEVEAEVAPTDTACESATEPPPEDTVGLTADIEAEVAPANTVCENAAEPTPAEIVGVTPEVEAEVAPADGMCENLADDSAAALSAQAMPIDAVAEVSCEKAAPTNLVSKMPPPSVLATATDIVCGDDSSAPAAAMVAPASPLAEEHRSSLSHSLSEGALPKACHRFQSTESGPPEYFEKRPSVGTWLHRPFLAEESWRRSSSAEAHAESCSSQLAGPVVHTGNPAMWRRQPSVGTWLVPRSEALRAGARCEKPNGSGPSSTSHSRDTARTRSYSLARNVQLWPATPESTPPMSPRRPSEPDCSNVVWMPIPVHMVAEVQRLLALGAAQSA